MVGTALGTKGRNPTNLSKYKRDRGSHEQEDRRGRKKKYTERKERNLTKKRIRKSSGKAGFVMAEIEACINKSTFLSP